MVNVADYFKSRCVLGSKGPMTNWLYQTLCRDNVLDLLVVGQMRIRIERSRFEPWPRSSCCVVREDTLLS